MITFCATMRQIVLAAVIALVPLEAIAQEKRWGAAEAGSEEAARIFRLLAEQSVEAQEALGVMYAGGDGVPKDLVLAYMWLDIAATNGRSFSGEYRDKIAEKMTPEQVAEAQRRAKVCMESNYKDCD